MSPELQDQIAKATVEVLRLPDVQQRFRGLNVEPIGNNPAEMAGYVKEDSQRWGEVIRKNNIVSE
jgi:tripartite-type tricarboxylate transporter receptor subunit TctC